MTVHDTSRLLVFTGGALPTGGVSPATHAADVAALEAAIDDEATARAAAILAEAIAREAADNLGDIIRLSSVTGTANAASGTVQAAQAHIAITGRQRIQSLWPTTNTAANPTLTIGATAYTIKRRDGSALAAGDLRGGAVYDFVLDPDAVNTLRLMSAVAVVDITGLQGELDALAATDDDLAAAIAVVDDARREVIRQTPDGMEITDPAGFSMLQITPDAMTFMGAWLLSRLASGGLGIEAPVVRITDDADAVEVTDPAGFSIFRAGVDGITWMGQPITGATVAVDVDAVEAVIPEVNRRTQAIRLPSARHSPKWRRARAGVTARLAQARIACVGDSNTMGWASGSGHKRAYSYPVLMADRIQDLFATSDNVFGRAIIDGTASAYPTYDPKTALGSGWAASGGASLGGEMWVNSTTTTEIVYTPAAAWDTADVWIALASAASLQIGISGDMDSHTPATGSIVKLTFTAASSAVQAFRIARISGTVQIIGWDCYNSAQRGVSILGMGRSAWKSSDYAAAGSFWSPRNALVALDPDLCLIQLGINDWNSDIAPATFDTNMRGIANAAAAVSDVAMIVPFEGSDTTAYPWASYVEVISDIASDLALPLIDISTRFGSYADASAAGLVTDQYHPNAYGYAETADLISKYLRM